MAILKKGLSGEPVRRLQAKLGVEMTDHGGHHINWFAPGIAIRSLSKGITHDGYELMMAMSK